MPLEGFSNATSIEPLNAALGSVCRKRAPPNVLAGLPHELARKSIDFVRLLDEYGIRVVPVSVEDQRAYGINVLTLGPRRIVGAEGVSEAYKKALAEASVQATWVSFDNLERGYGSADCMTQVLRRKLPTKVPAASR